MSTEEALKDFPELISYNHIKDASRKGFKSDNVRAVVWCVLTSFSLPVSAIEEDISLGGLYTDVQLSAKSLYDTITAKNEAKVASYPELSPNEEPSIAQTTELLLFLLKQRPYPEKCDFFTPLVRLLLSITGRIDMTYLVASDLLSNKEKKYLDATPVGIFITYFTFRKILEESMPKTYAQLMKIGALKSEYVHL